MDAAIKSATPSFVSSVAQFTSRISNVLHNYASLEGAVGQNRSSLIGKLDATVHSLNQLCSLLSLEAQQSSLLSDEGFKYVETLAEECSVVIDNIKLILTGNDSFNCMNFPKYWKSPVVVDEKGQKNLVVPDLDERALFRDIKNAKGRTLFRVTGEPAERLEYLQLLLLLVVQVMTVQDMTKKLPSGAVDLASIVEYHARIVRAAQKIRIASENGLARNTKSGLLYSPSILLESDSDFSTRHRPPLHSTRPSGPPPLSNGWKQLVPPPPSPAKEKTVFVESDPRCPLVDRTPLQPSVCDFGLPRPSPPPRIVEVEGENPKSIHTLYPPLYSEKAGAVESTTIKLRTPSLVSNVPSEKPKEIDEKSSNVKQDEKSIDQKRDEKPASTCSVDKDPKPSINDNARLLSTQSPGLRMKLKSLFRSKSSLEVEMKRTLSDSNASLTAFIVQREEFRKVPHSAFHSLEYTHMRTILWQLKDNTWFKIFSDLTEAEHDAMERLLEKFLLDGKWFQRELIVLKIMQQNKYNAWMRVIEDCMGLEYGKPHHENHRIILAIVREKQCDLGTVVSLPTIKTNSKIVDCYDPPQVPRVPDPLPIVRGDKMLVDLDIPSPLTLESHAGPPLMVPPPGVINRSVPYPQADWVGPPAPLPNNKAEPLSPLGEIQLGHSEVIPQNAISDESAREALTSYGAYTFRPALPQQSPLAPLIHFPPQTWARCFVTREREETRVLLQRMEKFRLRGVSIIDMKIQLTEPQAAQVTNLIQELNQLEKDCRFEHKMVELSMVDRENGIVTRQTTGTNIDVIHVIVKRAPKQGVSSLVTYNALMWGGPPPPRVLPPLSRGPPPPPPNKEAEEIIIIESNPGRRSPLRKSMGKCGRHSIARSSYSDSTSDSDSPQYSTPDDSDSDSSPEDVYGRWKVDPIDIRFGKTEKGKDIVQLLLERWTPVGEGKAKEKG